MRLKKDYRYILFDLDRTLWDFDTNARNNIFSLLDKHRVQVSDKAEFFITYDEINHRLWGGVSGRDAQSKYTNATCKRGIKGAQ